MLLRIRVSKKKLPRFIQQLEFMKIYAYAGEPYGEYETLEYIIKALKGGKVISDKGE